METEPFLPLMSSVALIVTLPDLMPVTTPLCDTEALLLELDQKKVWFGTVFPLLSFAVAVSCIVFPTFRLGEGAVTVTVATAPGSTVIVAVPLTLPIVAVIVAGPAFAVVTSAVSFPVDFGDATCTSDDVHVTVLPVTALPFTSRTVAVSVTTWPAVALELDGLIVIEAIGGAVTVTFDEPVFPPLEASMVVFPTATPVTTPVLGSTLATEGFLDDQVTLGFCTVAPVASTTVAVSVPVCPCARDRGFGLTDTDCMGAAVTVMVDVPVAEPLVAEMVAVPAATPVTTPACETVAMRESLVPQLTGRFVTT